MGFLAGHCALARKFFFRSRFLNENPFHTQKILGLFRIRKRHPKTTVPKLQKNSRRNFNIKKTLQSVWATIIAIEFRLAIVSFIIAITLWAHVKGERIKGDNSSATQKVPPPFQKE